MSFKSVVGTRNRILGIRRGKDIETAVVCNMFDSDGELAAAVASVEAIVSFFIKNA